MPAIDASGVNISAHELTGITTMLKPFILLPLLTSVLLASVSGSGFAQAPTKAEPERQSLAKLLSPDIYKAPKVYPHPKLDQGHIKAIFYEGLKYQGKPTRVFGYLGIPKSDKPVPGMVLVHGGGGTAFPEWVKVWNDRGYAAIAMSLEGDMPQTADGRGKQAHKHSGPSRVGMFADIDKPLKDQWMYHAVSDCVLAHSLLASLPEVDTNRIGITGISWGGILCSLVSGVDSRLKCAIPVYGCGYLSESKGHFSKLRLNESESNKKKKYWDPANQFVRGYVPTLWVNGDSDAHFSINCTSRSFKATHDHAYLCIHPSMPHGHRAGWDPRQVPEIYAFADWILKRKKPGWPRIKRQPSGRRVNIAFESDRPVREAMVYYLNEKLTYRVSRKSPKHSRPGPWLRMPAKVNAEDQTITAVVPNSCRTYYVNLKTNQGHICSSVLVELER